MSTDSGAAERAPKPLYGSKLRRFTEPEQIGNPKTLAEDHRAVVDGETQYPARVKHVADVDRCFKSGEHNKKIGKEIVKGKWVGMPIYTLTLEERATCPRTCTHWRDCYGNKMNWSVRLRHGPALEHKLEAELEALQAEHPAGFVVRLHVLGDFYSPEYVAKWGRWLVKFPALRVYGYTAWKRWDDIGYLINILNMRPDRWVVRFSDAGGYDGTITVGSVIEAEIAGAIPCPAQTQKSECCATCGLCWSKTDKPIAFQRH